MTAFHPLGHTHWFRDRHEAKARPIRLNFRNYVGVIGKEMSLSEGGGWEANKNLLLAVILLQWKENTERDANSRKQGEIITNDWMQLIAFDLLHLSSVQFSHSVMSDSLRPHESQYARPPCSSQTPGVYSNSCALSWRCHPAISSSVVPFFSCPQSLPASVSFPVSQLFAWDAQTIGVSASASVLPMNTHDLSPSGWTGWIFLQSGTLKSCLQHHSSKAAIFWCSAFFTVQLSHPYMTTGKTIALTRWTIVGKVMSLCQHLCAF